MIEKLNTSILYTVKLGGAYEILENIQNLIESILDKSEFKNFEIHIYYEENINQQIKKYFSLLNIKNISYFSSIKLSWYEWLKSSFAKSKNFTYLITMHSDCHFLTDKYDYKLINQVNNISNLGIFTMLDEVYKRGFYYPQLRKGFYIDQIQKNSRSLGIDGEYCHQKINWHNKNIKIAKILKILKLDVNYNMKLFNLFSQLKIDKISFPKNKIKTHGLWSHLMCFKTENIKYFSNIINFDINHALYADEDLCFLSMKSNLVNIFVPSVSFIHNRPEFGQTRSFDLITKDKKKVEKKFYQKWKFYPSTAGNFEEYKSLIKKIESLHGKKLTWSKNFESFDWDSFYI